MNRADLGSFGAGMSEGELAQALAAFCVWAESGYGGTPSVNAVERSLARLGADGLVEATTWWMPDPAVPQDAATFSEAWRRMMTHHPLGLRIEVHKGRGDSEAENAAWLARQLLHPSVGAMSVYQRRDEPDWPVAWEWPLRLGVLGSRRKAHHKQLAEALAKVHHPKLWTQVDMLQPGAECELLLLPGDLRQALGDVLDAPQRPRADCVIVLGAHQLSPGRSVALATAVRREARAAGVALLSVGQQIEPVMSELISELSHDKTLDVALFEALRIANRRQKPQLPMPELICSRSLVIHSSVRLTAARMARDFSSQTMSIPIAPTGLPAGAALQPSAEKSDAPLEAAAAPDPVVTASSKALESLVRDGQWQFESSDASNLVQIRAQVQGATGRTHRAARMAAGAASPQPVAESDEREVLTQVLDRDSKESIKVLRRQRAYRLRVRIDKPDEQSVGAGMPFPTHELPTSEVGHTLDASFVPLTGDTNGVFEPAQQATLFLPTTGASTVCEFAFSTQETGEAFRARLLISYANRILQTLRLDAQLSTEADAVPYTLAVENLVQAGFQNLAYHPPFDAAIVVNHSEDGVPGVTALVGTKVSFLRPEGMGESIQALQDTLTSNTRLRQAESGLDSPVLGKLIWGLMQHGRVLYDHVASLIGSLDRDAGRIQLVEARVGAAFPVEYLYPLPIPRKRPPMCPNAKGALTGEKGAVSHQDCQHREDPDHMCPMRFWGFRKQVERQPAGVVPSKELGDVTTLAVPSVLNGRLDLLGSVQVARSKKVEAIDYDLPEGLLKVLKGTCGAGAVHTPADWDQWRGSVQQQSPGFLLLLSHTDMDEDSNLPALEISEDMLPLAAIESDYVKGPKASAPVVFLLGCGTADPKFGFINFVERFKSKQAALVVGTLSTISARRAARFLAGALPQFKAAANSGRTFGEVFLQVKRAALAEGDGFALSLVAYGDTSWQL